jgi:hypothetical protein
MSAPELEAVSVTEVQEAVAAAVRLYVAKQQSSGEAFPPVADGALTATEAAVIASALLRSAQVETFELALWNSLGRM